MTNFMAIFGIAISVCGIVMGITGLTFSLFMHRTSARFKRFFKYYYIALILYGAFGLTAGVLFGLPPKGLRLFSMGALFLEYLLSSVTPLLFTLFLVTHFKNEEKSELYLPISIGLWSAYVLLLTMAQFTILFYSVDSNNHFDSGAFYPALLVPILLISLVNFIAVINKKKLLSEKELWIFACSSLIPIACAGLQMIYEHIPVILLGSALCGYLMLLYQIQDQKEKFEKETEKVARQQISIMTLQMRPHFIFNTLTSIYYIIESDPAKAQDTIENFTSYLRQNFTLVAQEGLIDFDQELEHTKAYLAVEKVRYEKLLFVDYDVTCHSFTLPPLTLQSIVENAVKHGVDPELNPMHLLIKTFKNPRGYYIVVEDNGPGYDESAPSTDQKGHIGLKNVRYRLGSICNGTLTIVKGDQGGTKATIFIPANIDKAN